MRAIAACISVVTWLALAAGTLAAQDPAPPPRPPRDTVRLAPSDSAARDSVVTRILEQDSAGTVRPAAFSLLGLDRLRLRSLGATVGWVWPGQAQRARIYSLQSDYGELWRGVRVSFVSSYWSSRFDDAEVARLAREVQRVVVDPSRDDSVALGPIRVADLSAGIDARWRPGAARRAHAFLRVVRPWVGGGVAAHFVNVEGSPVSGTFVERALDAAAIGLAGMVGLDLNPLPNFQMTMQARYDFLSTVRYASVRAGANFVFGPAGAP